jgi:Large polyvalent protein associated domain 38
VTDDPTIQPDGEENPFSQFVATAESYSDKTFGERFAATAKAHFYKGTLLGTGIAAAQADPEARNETLMQGLSPEEQQLGREQMAQGLADEAKANQGAENPVRVTPAQIAQIKNDLYPKMDSFSTGAADVLGALAGGAASPETFVLPEVGATALGLRIAGRLLPEAVAGFAGRSFETGASMAVAQTAINPAVQAERQKGLLQPEFDLGEWALSPAEGFAGGVVLHGAGEAIGAGVRSIAGRVRAGFRSGAEREFEHLYSDPAFRPADASARPAEALPGEVPLDAFGLPPVAPGMTRFFHGGTETAAGGGRWITPWIAYAQNFRGGQGGLHYVDIPTDSPLLKKAFDDTGTDQASPFVSFEAPEEIAKQLKPVPGSPKPTTDLPLEVVKSGEDHATLAAGKPDGNTVEYQVNKTGTGEFTVSRAETDTYGQPVEWRTGTLDPNGQAIEPHLEAGKDSPDSAVFPTKDEAVAFAQRQEGHTPEAANENLPAPEQAAAGSDLQFRRRTKGGRDPSDNAPTAEGEAPNEPIKSLQQQAFNLAEKLDFPLRQGRLKGADVLGQYNAKYGVARVRQVADFYTVAHEGGHALEAQIGKPLSDLIEANRGELSKLDYDATRGSPSEGFSEFFATSLTNPAAAQKAAPTFYSEFRQFLSNNKPDLLRDLDAAAESYKAYLAAPSDQRIASQIVDGERHGWIKETIKEVRENGVPHTIRMFFGTAYTRLVDRNYPVARTTRNLIRAIHEKTGDLVDVKPSENPAKLIQLFANARQGAVVQLRWGVIPYRSLEAAGPSMYDAINHAAGGPRVLGLLNHETTSDLSTYMVAKRVSNLWDRHANGDLENLPAAFSKADAEKAMADLMAKNPRLDEAAMMAHEFTRNMLTKQRDAGLIKQDLYEKLTQDPFYVPLFRDVKDKPMAGSPSGGGKEGPGSVDTIRKLRGSSRDIIDPIQGIMMQTLLAERTIRHNDIIRGLVELAERAGEGGKGVVEPLPAKELYGTTFDLAEQIRGAARSRGMDPNDTELLMNSVANAFGTEDPIMHTMFRMDLASKRGEPILFYKEAGDVKAARLTAAKEGQALYETLATLPPAATDIWSRVLSRSTKFLRLGVVAHPTFVLTNFIKDQIGVSILRPDYAPFFSGVKGIWTEASQGEASRLYAYLGGMSAGTATSGIREIEKNAISQITKRSYAAIHLTSFESLHELTQITEGATRNSIFEKVYKQKLKQGLSPIDAGIEAAHQGTDVMDFGMHGSHTLAVRAFVPFLNPHVQGLNKAVRTMIVPLARLAKGDILSAEDQAAAANAGWALGKMTALGGTLGAVWAALNWEKESYRDATPDQKGQNLIIPIGNKTYRMPKPYELGLGFTAGEYAYARLAQQDPRGARQLAEAAYEVLALPDLLASNPLVKTFVETRTGVSMFTGRAIVPDTLNQRDPQYQYNAKTSGIARKVGDFSNLISDKLNAWTGSSTNPWSPMLVDNAIGNLAGGMGKELQIRSRILLGDEDRPADRFEDAAFVKRFTLDPARWSSTVQRYYEFAAQKTGDYARAANTYQFLYDTPRTRGDAADFLAGLTDDKKAYAILQIGGNEEGKGAFKPDDRRLNPIKRAQDAVAQVHSLSRELLDNTTTNTADGTTIKLDPERRRNAQDALQSLGNMEMRNALVMIGDQGYQGRKLFDIRDQFNVLKAISSEVADELSRRYATAKIYKADYVNGVWPEIRSALVAGGSAADLSGYADDAKSEGYEFDGERTKRRLKQRGAIPAAGATTH